MLNETSLVLAVVLDEGEEPLGVTVSEKLGVEGLEFVAVSVDVIVVECNGKLLQLQRQLLQVLSLKDFRIIISSLHAVDEREAELQSFLSTSTSFMIR